jgi:OmpA family
VNPPGPTGGPGTGVVRRTNPPGPAGGPGVAVRINPPGPAGGPGTSVRLNSRSVLRSLSIVPRRIAPAVVLRPGVPVPGRPRTLVRVYDRTRNVVIVPAEDGQSAELPYIAVPILFSVGTAELLDDTADADLQALAEALLEIHVQEPEARFEIEGHTSTDGEDQENLTLSAKRASHVYAVLVSRYHVPAAILSTKGFGETYADYPNGTEQEMQMDRRVLVVRTQ